MKTILEIENITKRFGGLTALRGVTIKIPEKRIIAVIGPNGAGKTTLFNIITGFMKPDEGKIIFKGIDITKYPPYKIAKLGITRTFQIPKPFLDLTVRESILTGAVSKYRNIDKAKAKTEEILQFLGIDDLADKYCSELNLSQTKIMELGRSLSIEPEVLLLDELVAGLNPKEVSEMSSKIRKINEEKGITIILVEHIMRFVLKISDYIYVLHYGELISEGKPDELIKDEKVIQAYLGSQGKG